jgi:hypothetical protein
MLLSVILIQQFFISFGWNGSMLNHLVSLHFSAGVFLVVEMFPVGKQMQQLIRVIKKNTL